MSLHQDGRAVKSLPTIDELLHNTPLPPELAHLEETIRSLPDVGVLIEAVIGCMHAGFTDDQVSAAVCTIAEYLQRERNRCSCCLAWRPNGRTFARAAAGRVELISICPTCENLIQTGRGTPRMLANLRNYLGVD